jgi:putative spermidine/putrescine transport system substrate-binding protein
MRRVSSVLLAAFALTTFASNARAGQFDGVTVRVATFGGTWQTVVAAHVEKAFAGEGGKIEYVLSQPNTNLAKLLASRGQEPPFDILETLDEYLPVLENGKYLVDINLANVPSAADLAQGSVNSRRIPIYSTEEGIIYNTKKLEELGVAAPKKFVDLADPRLQGKVIIPDISASATIPLLVGMAREQGGSEANIDPGLKLIQQIKPAAFWSSSSILETQLANGDAWAGLGQAGNVLRMRKQVDVGFTHPMVGQNRGLLKQNYMVLIAGLKNQRAAEWVLNAFVSEEMQVAILTEAGQVPVSRKALEKLSGNPQYSFLLLRPEDVANMYRVDFTKVDVNSYIQKWNRMLGH